MRIAITALGSVLALSCGDTLGAGGLESLETSASVDLTQDVSRDVGALDFGSEYDPGWSFDPGGLDSGQGLDEKETAAGPDVGPDQGGEPDLGVEPDPDTGPGPDSEEQDEGTPNTDVPSVDLGPNPTCEAGGCDDGNQCTADLCIVGQGCVYSNLTLPCDDGNACTTGDKCTDGTCVGGPPPDCDDEDLCTDDTCEPATGCVHTEVVCDDGDYCTEDNCVWTIGCYTAPYNDCHDDDACTVDLCDPIEGCSFEPVVCDDGDPCTIDLCDSGTGCYTEPVDCDDGDPCTIDSCDSGCVNEPEVNCVAWVDTATTSCAGDIVDTLLPALPVEAVTYKIVFHQEDSVIDPLTESTGTKTPSTCPREWLEALDTGNIPSYFVGEEFGPVCFHNFYYVVAEDGWGGHANFDLSAPVTFAFRDRTTPPCDLTLSDAMLDMVPPGEPMGVSNNSEYGTAGDYIKITWE